MQNLVFLFFIFSMCACQLTIIRGGMIYTPEKLGVGDVIIGGSKIINISKPNMFHINLPVTTIDATGMIVIPGFIDPHVHLTGGGGEIGPYSRVPEAKLHEMIEAGITTCVGTSLN